MRYVKELTDHSFSSQQNFRSGLPCPIAMVKRPAAGSVQAIECTCIIYASLDFKFTHTHLYSHKT